MRLRVGDWRVIYTDELLVLRVIKVGPRGSVYDWGMESMKYQPQHFTAPDGTEMVVIRASDFERLVDLAEGADDVAAALAIEARIEAGEGTMPGEVLDMIIDDEMHPVAAWRRYRGLSQAALARKTKLSQVWISRIERGGGYGSRETRRKLAEALDAPRWALEDGGQ